MTKNSAAYPPIVGDRSIKKIKSKIQSKIQEGLALRPGPTSNQ